MVAAFAELETNLRCECQMEGIAKAKIEGAYDGRKPSIDCAAIEALRAEGRGRPKSVSGLGSAAVLCTD